MAETLHGTIGRIYFSGAKFTAGLLITEDAQDVRFTGKFCAAEGDSVTMVGSWVIDPKYGHQFKVQKLTYDLPQTSEGLKQYLAKHPAFTGIGPATAAKIVDYVASAEHLDRMLRQNIDELHDVLRIPKSTLQSLSEAWIANSAENEIRSYLAGFGLTHHQTQTLLERFGNSVVGVLRSNPYMLIKAIKGYGFKKVDKVARAMGTPKDHPGRIEAGLIYCLNEQFNSGHTWTPGSDLIALANDVLVLDSLDSKQIIRQAARKLVDDGDLVADGNAVSTPYYLEAERLISDTFCTYAWQQALLIHAHNHAAVLNEDQRRAYQMAMKHPISVITGGAGTGKTFVITRLTETFQAMNLSVALCAPTGKAAKRIEQLLIEAGIKQQAKTIHRLLEYDGTTFNRESLSEPRDSNDDEDEGYDVVIVDEVSMVDVPLMAELLGRMDLKRTRLILVGDHNQLPPVGAGNVLRDIVHHDLVPTVVLERVERQAGVLKANCTAILSGKLMPTAVNDGGWQVIDLFTEPEHIQTHLRDLIINKIPKRLGYDPVRDVQIITPTHIGKLGTKTINAMMQHLLRDDPVGKARFVVGDKVIQMTNDYTLGVMNGTIGCVESIQTDGVMIDFEGAGIRFVEREKLASVQLAYALTAHKAQGSEFPCVIVLCHKSHYFADRNWLYTATTRAAKTCVILGDQWGLRHVVKKNNVIQRRTFLSRWATQHSQEAA